MATEPQTKANRATAAKSKGPAIRSAKRISSKNAALPKLISGAAYDRQCNHAATMFPKLSETLNSSPSSSPPRPGMTIFKSKPILRPHPKGDLLCDE
jgi:hypothetical protein